MKRPATPILLLTLLLACAATATCAAAEDPMAATQSAMTQLDQLRAVEAKDPQRVLDLLKRGADALAEAKRALAEDVAFPSTAPAPRTRKPDPSQNAAAAQRRLNLCRIAFLQTELHRRAALALPADHEQRSANFEAALAQSKALRVEYRDIVPGRLGYAGEARVHRARGDVTQADAVLANVVINLDDKRLSQQPAPVLQVQRVLWLERIENAMERGSAGGLMAELEKSALMQEASPAERAALKWLAAQGAAQAALAGNADAGAAAAQVRDSALAGAAPEHQRLALLVQLSARRGVKLAAAEQLAWSRLQSWAGLIDEALETYAAAAKERPQEIPPADWLAYGALLHGAGRIEAAADALSRGSESIPPDSPQRVATLQVIAAGRLKAASGDASKRPIAIEALWQLASATGDAGVRRDALRSWAHLQQQTGAIDAQWPALREKFADDVKVDPYLCLVVSQGELRAATGGPSATRSAAVPAELAREIRENLSRLLPDAGPELAPSLVLLMAHAAAASPDGARAAMDVIAQREATLKPDAPATPQVMALKLQLLMELGLTAEAVALAARIEGGSLSPAVALRLGDMLADRYAGDAAVASPQARDQVVQLVSRGLASYPPDATYRDAALSAARTLLKVEAYADAQQILSGIKTASGDERMDPAPALLAAQALLGQGKVEQAQRLLDSVARDNPEAGEVHLAMGRLQAQLQQWEPAAAAYRSARKQIPPGREPWWHATVGLADALTQQGNAAAAQELLRVANAMYRSRAPASLLPRIDELLKPRVSSAR